MTHNPWPPIPAHTIEIGGRPMLPERLIEVDGKPYLRCHLHGLIPADHRCGDSPSDHCCGEAAHPNQPEGEDQDDQGTPWSDWESHLLDRINVIRELHQQGGEPGGGTTGFCTECRWQYPCPTVHAAQGWGTVHDCEEAGWCHHAGVPLARPPS